MVITPRLATNTGIGLVVCLMLGYFTWQLSPVFRAPRLLLLVPKRDLIVADPEFFLAGGMDKNSTLTINHEDVYVDGDGNFSQQIYLTSGLNTMDITAESVFGRKTNITRYIILKKQITNNK